MDAVRNKVWRRVGPWIILLVAHLRLGAVPLSVPNTERDAVKSHLPVFSSPASASRPRI